MADKAVTQLSYKSERGFPFQDLEQVLKGKSNSSSSKSWTLDVTLLEQAKRPTLVAVSTAVALSVSEWNDGREKTWQNLFETLSLPFFQSLAAHFQDKDRKREEQRTKRFSEKEQSQLARKLDRMIDAESDSAAVQAEEEEVSENCAEPESRRGKKKERPKPFSPQKTVCKRTSKGDTYGGEYGKKS